jgi:hypothetical protein
VDLLGLSSLEGAPSESGGTTWSLRSLVLPGRVLAPKERKKRDLWPGARFGGGRARRHLSGAEVARLSLDVGPWRRLDAVVDAVDAPRSRPERPRASSAGPPRSPHPKKRRQKIVAALALSGASALVAPAAPRATVKVQETKADLERLCAENPTALPFEGIWDPLGCADFNFWGLGNEATIGYLRHAEIKHGRIAMAGFLGFFVQSPGNFIGDIVSGDHAILPYRGYVAGCSPQEQWANIPMIGKLQILTAVGMLESYGEGAGYPESYTHYTKGGQPGYYPPIKGKGGPFKQILLDLYDPLGFGFRDMSAADKKKGLFAEINNGRMAMIGLVPCRTQISGATRDAVSGAASLTG